MWPLIQLAKSNENYCFGNSKPDKKEYKKKLKEAIDHVNYETSNRKKPPVSQVMADFENKICKYCIDVQEKWNLSHRTSQLTDNRKDG